MADFPRLSKPQSSKSLDAVASKASPRSCALSIDLSAERVDSNFDRMEEARANDFSKSFPRLDPSSSLPPNDLYSSRASSNFPSMMLISIWHIRNFHLYQ